VNLYEGAFDGISAYIEIPSSNTLNLGTEDFTINAWVFTEKIVDDVIGDILSKYDPVTRRGITLSINSTGGGYQSIGTDRHVYFGIDNARISEWQDCGKPSPESVYISNSMTVFNGKLYAAVANAKEEKDWAHVFRYEGGTKW